MNKSVLAIIFLMLQITVNAQIMKNKYEFGVGLDGFIYQGDLAPSKIGSWKTPGLGINISGSRILNRFFILRTQLAFGKLRGDDSKYSKPDWRQERNFKFKTPLFEISESFIWNIRGTNNTPNKSSGLSPYLFTGIGYSFLKIKRNWSNFNSDFFASENGVAVGLAADAAHKLPRGTFVLLAGAGLRYPLSNNFLLNAEAPYRFIPTDYLDGFSLAANPNKKDSYYSLSIGLIYKIGNFKWWKCPRKP